MKTKLTSLLIVSVLIFSLAANVSNVDARRSLPNSQSVPTSCKSIDGLPDSKCTPGSVDPRVTQANIKNTICKIGYTKTVRPPVSYTEPLKIKLMKSYGIKGSLKDYEFDHLIPLEIGGNPTDVKNLWPESHSSSFTKDGLEYYLHKQVCSGNMKLEDAQKAIATNWYDYWMTVKN